MLRILLPLGTGKYLDPQSITPPAVAGSEHINNFATALIFNWVSAEDHVILAFLYKNRSSTVDLPANFCL